MSAALKILHTYKIYRPDIDGGIPYAIAMLCRFSSVMVSNAILVARRFGASKRYRQNGVPVEAVWSLGTLFSTPVAPNYPFAWVARARDADVVVHHAPFPLTDFVTGLMPPRVALVVFWHAEIVGYGALRRLVAPAIRRTLARADRIVVSDQSIIDRSSFLQPFGSKCVVVPYGIDVGFWRHCTAAEAGTAQDIRSRHPRMIAAVGRLVSYKGFDVLIRAMKDVDGHLMLIGEGPLDASLKQLAANIGVSDRVTFAGRLTETEVKSHLHAARMLAFPSVTIAEAFGIVQLEAMAAGLPIVNTALPTAVPVIARHEREALTVAPGDALQLSAALTRLLDDEALAARLGAAGQERAIDEYSEARFLCRMKAVYDDAVAARQLACSHGDRGFLPNRDLVVAKDDFRRP
ncbi:MAG TPA: glycosyltransferase [Xanthobacteraceae bacterium]|nr:glycosyltransferase [Xanthobacteraceae bacterium]